mmetsp:Transcript_2356/g.3190  ORF Transcript_2356/g.3190 Transcript_2356/m.3190 type:complete len:125 (+) Transcript_2356:418-792(+)
MMMGRTDDGRSRKGKARAQWVVGEPRLVRGAVVMRPSSLEIIFVRWRTYLLLLQKKVQQQEENQAPCVLIVSCSSLMLRYTTNEHSILEHRCVDFDCKNVYRNQAVLLIREEVYVPAKISLTQS